MITIISATNRNNSRSLHVANFYFQHLQAQGIEAQLLSLSQLKTTVRNDDFIALEKQFFLPADKFIFIVPEYNGTFPGIFKLMLDMSDTRKCWYHKKVLLTGVADGRAGNLRGLDHMTNMLHYMRMDVYYNKIPLSRINEEMDMDGKMLLSETVENIQAQINGFVAW